MGCAFTAETYSLKSLLCHNRTSFGTVVIVSEVKVKSSSKSSRTTGCSWRSKYFTKRLAVLRAHDFRLFYIGYATSQFGTAMSAVAIAFALQAT